MSLPAWVGVLGKLQPSPDLLGLQGWVATFHQPMGVDVKLVREDAPAVGQADYRGKWGRAGIVKAVRVVDPRFGSHEVLRLWVDAPDMPDVFNMVAIEDQEPDHFTVYWCRAFSDPGLRADWAGTIFQLIFSELI